MRFFTPTESLLIAGVLPQQGPPCLIWELAGNACSPLLLFEALRLVSPSEICTGFPVVDLRKAWLRKLGMPSPGRPANGVFPGPIDTSILIMMDNVTKVCRTQDSATMRELYGRASILFGLDPEEFNLCSDGLVLGSEVHKIAGDLYGQLLLIVRVNCSNHGCRSFLGPV